MPGPSRPHRPINHDPRRTHADRSTTDRSTDALLEEAVLLYTPAEAAQRLRVRESWLRKKAAARQVPCTFLGKHLRFSPADLAAIVAASARPAVGRRSRRKPSSVSASTSATSTLATSASTLRDRDLPV